MWRNGRNGEGELLLAFKGGASWGIVTIDCNLAGLARNREQTQKNRSVSMANLH